MTEQLVSLNLEGKTHMTLLKGIHCLAFFFWLLLWAVEKEFSVLSWHKNVGYDCRDMANNKDGQIVSAVYASNALGSKV